MPLTSAHLIAVATWPVVLGVGTVGAALALHAGRWPAPFVVVVAVYAVGMVALLLQRLAPSVPSWRWWREDTGVDMWHIVLSTLGGSMLARAVRLGVVATIPAALVHEAGPWPNELPFPVQFALALIVADGIAWVLHAASHRFAWLWRFHEMHHSSERLHVLSAGRTHPVFVALTQLAQTMPMAALGAPAEVLALLTAFTGFVGVLQHANISVRTGWLDYVFATAALHRWHHDATDQGRNFGNNLALWDLVFGTWYRPPDATPERVGLNRPYPRTWFQQVIEPFRRARSR